MTKITNFYLPKTLGIEVVLENGGRKINTPSQFVCEKGLEEKILLAEFVGVFEPGE
jgi:hypothetical protein